MSDPLVRTLTLLEILQGRDHVSGAELAERLDVDLRTVQRYIARLKELGIPVGSSPGVGGAYRLRPGFRLPPLMLTNEEAFALSLGLRSLRSVGLAAFAPATEGALRKLSRVLPQALRESLHTVEEVVAIEPGPWVVATPVQSLITAATAIREQRRVKFCYESHTKEQTEREVEPYAVLHADDRWYMVGWCRSRAAVRTFRLDRVSELTMRTETFVAPENFDAKKHLAERMPFLQSRYKVDVWIDMPYAEAKENFLFWRVVAEEEGEGTRLRCGRDKLELLAAVLLSTGKRVVVREPQELRAMLRRMAERAMEAAGS